MILTCYCSEKLEAVQTRRQGNEQQKAVLEVALEQHEHLRLELGATLAKIMERLSRVLADGGDEENQEGGDDSPTTVTDVVAATQPTTTTAAATSMDIATATTEAASAANHEVRNDQQVSEETIDDLSMLQQQQEKASTSIDDDRLAEKWAELRKQRHYESKLITNIPHLNTSEFWDAKRDEYSLLTVLPSLSSADAIRHVMDIRAMEALVWDRVTPPNHGRHRLESLWNTCVDFCLMGHIRQNQPDHQDPPSQPVEAPPPPPVIDPEVALCPNELIGSGGCEDMSCAFQHLRPRPMPLRKHDMVHPASPHHHSDRQDEPSILDKSPADESSSIDPNIALCPYELTGVCADSLCPYQHLNPRPEDLILPRELLPLPPLKLPPSRLKEENAEARNETKPRGPKIAIDHPKTTPTITDVAVSKPSDDPIAGNDDFVTMPEITNSEESDEESETEEGLEDWHIKVRHASEAPSDFWWRDNANEQTKSPTLVYGVLPCLGFLSAFSQCGKVSKSIIFTGKLMSNPLEVIKFVGCVVDCTSFLIHAGRIDLAKAIGNHCAPYIRKMQRRANILPKHTETCLIDALEVMKEAVGAAFTFDAHQQNPLIAAFDNAVLLAILGTLVKSFYDHLNDPEKAARNAEHHATFSCLLGQIRDAVKVDGEVVNPNEASFEGKKDILDHCCALFTPQPAALPKQQSTEEDARDGDFLDVRLVLATFLSSRPLYLNLAKSSDFVIHRQEVLEAFWKEAKVQLRSSSFGVLQAAIAVGAVLFGCIGSVVDCIPDKQNIDPTTVASLTAFDRTLYHIVSCLRDDYLKFLFGGILVAPLVAASTSLAVLLRNYPKAQHRLEDTLATKGHIGQSKVAILAMSELLLSQLVVLRSSLPFDATQAKSLEGKNLLSSLDDSHSKVARVVEYQGAHLAHVTLDGDRNLLLLQKLTKTGKRVCKLIASAVATQRDEHPHEIRLLGLKPLRHRATFNRESCCVATFPHGIFLASGPVLKFELNQCDADLPLSFGYHFQTLTTLIIFGCSLQMLPESIGNLTTLKVLNLERNKLSQIPDSIGQLTNLEVMNVSTNELTTLPSTMEKLVELTEFRVQNNHLTIIPLGLLGCKKLGVLHLGNNFLTSAVTTAFLTLYFPQLHDLKLQPQRSQGKKSSTQPSQVAESPNQSPATKKSKKDKQSPTQQSSQPPQVLENMFRPTVSQGESFFNQSMNLLASSSAASDGTTSSSKPPLTKKQRKALRKAEEVSATSDGNTSSKLPLTKKQRRALRKAKEAAKLEMKKNATS